MDGTGTDDAPRPNLADRAEEIRRPQGLHMPIPLPSSTLSSTATGQKTSRRSTELGVLYQKPFACFVDWVYTQRIGPEDASQVSKPGLAPGFLGLGGTGSWSRDCGTKALKIGLGEAGSWPRATGPFERQLLRDIYEGVPEGGQLCDLLVKLYFWGVKCLEPFKD